MEDFKYLKEKEIVPNAFQSVFVIIYSRKRERISKSIIREVPGFLTIFRSDGRLGFPGGRLEPKDIINNKIDETALRNTAIRECREEIGYSIGNSNNLKFESSLLLGKNQITTFSYLVTDEELNTIYKNYSNVIGGYYNEDELYGLMRLYVKNNSIKKNILRQNFKPSAKDEIERLLNKYF